MLTLIDSVSRIQVSTPKKILVLGSGFVAKPLVDYLLRSPNYSVTIGTHHPLPRSSRLITRIYNLVQQ